MKCIFGNKPGGIRQIDAILRIYTRPTHYKRVK